MTNALRTVRPVFAKTFQKALDELERSWEEDSTKAAPASFKLTLEVTLANGQRIGCNPEGMFPSNEEPSP